MTPEPTSLPGGNGGVAPGGRRPPDPYDRRRETLVILLGIALLLALVPLAHSLGLFGGGSTTPVRVGFLPFQSPPGDDALQQAATELVEGAHARFRREDDPRLNLLGPSVTQPFDDSATMPEDIGRRIGADVVVAGGLRHTDDGRVQVSAALVRVQDGRSLWTGEMQVADPSDMDSRRRLGEWLHDRVRRTLRTVRPPD